MTKVSGNVNSKRKFVNQFFVTIFSTDFKLVKSVKLSDSITGAAILETEYQTMLRGLIKDPVWVGKYPDNVSVFPG